LPTISPFIYNFATNSWPLMQLLSNILICAFVANTKFNQSNSKMRPGQVYRHQQGRQIHRHCRGASDRLSNLSHEQVAQSTNYRRNENAAMTTSAQVQDTTTQTTCLGKRAVCAKPRRLLLHAPETMVEPRGSKCQPTSRIRIRRRKSI
jgi:hypothetical protein